jgi:hypothetical protein
VSAIRIDGDLYLMAHDLRGDDVSSGTVANWIGTVPVCFGCVKPLLQDDDTVPLVPVSANRTIVECPTCGASWTVED